MILVALGGLIAAFVLVVFLRSLWIRSGLNVRQTLLTLGVAALIIGIVALTVTGRLNWIVAALAAMIPLVRRIGTLVRFVPWLAALFPRFRSTFGSTSNSQANNEAGSTTTESSFFRMTLHHASGHMDGEIKQGAHKGHFLSELDVPKLVGLLADIRDYDSQRLLEAYLDHHHPEWRSNGKREPAAAGQNMTRSEALSALGLGEDATHDDIVAAHRRLIQKLHPDRGGSTYLAALLNRAKDTLTKDR
jgi:hypothetical protein